MIRNDHTMSTNWDINGKVEVLFENMWTILLPSHQISQVLDILRLSLIIYLIDPTSGYDTILYFASFLIWSFFESGPETVCCT